MATVAAPQEWLTARKSLLEKEKEHTRAYDALVQERRKLPIVPIEKDYKFTAPDGTTKSLSDLFNGRRQLVLYHFMLGPEKTEGCHACSMFVDHLPHLSHINSRDTTVVVVSRAPIETIEKFKKRMGWTFSWYSSYGSDFNYDFHVTMDESKIPILYNFDDEVVLEEKGLQWFKSGEQSGLSCFLMGKKGDGEQKDRVVYHTYSTYGRGVDHLMTTHGLLDLTALGRQDEKYAHTMSYKYHDKYDEE